MLACLHGGGRPQPASLAAVVGAASLLPVLLQLLVLLALPLWLLAMLALLWPLALLLWC